MRRDLAALSQLHAQPSAGTARVSVNQIIEDSRELLKVHLSLGNTLKIDIQPEDVLLQINGTDLIQILLNLAINAFQCSAQPHSVAISGQLLENGADLFQLFEGPNDRILFRQSFTNTTLPEHA